MKQVSLEIDQPAYKPNDRLTTNLVWSNSENSDAELTLKLLWHTEGFGTVDHGIIEERKIAKVSSSGADTVEFQLPSEPVTVHGTYVSVVWCIELSVGNTLLERKSFVLSPTLSPIEVPRSKIE